MSDHPITPSLELVREWAQVNGEKDLERFWMRLATQAARWGADQELNECCKWLPKLPPWSADDLRKHRRPKPPSLKERALQAWAAVEAGTDDQTAMAVIRRALEQLDD